MRRAMLRIVSQASSVDALVGLFAGLCDGASLAVVTRAPARAGTRTRFVLALATGAPVMAGVGDVEPSPTGMRIRFVELDDASRALAARMATQAPAGPTTQAECAVYQEPDLTAPGALGPQVPAAPHVLPATSPAVRPGIPNFYQPQSDELTEIVRPLPRPTRPKKVVALSAVTVLVLGAVAVAMLWNQSPSASTSQRSDAAPPAMDASAAATEAPAASCQVRVTSTPEGATVSTQGRTLGTTPLETTLPCGPIELRIEHPRYRAETVSATLLAGDPSEITARLERLSVALEIVSTPAGAAVAINGKPVGNTPVTMTLEANTRVQLTVKKSGYRTYRERIQLEPPTTRVDVALRKRR